MAAGDITTQPKQGRQAGPMSSLCILICLWFVLPFLTFRDLTFYWASTSSSTQVILITLVKRFKVHAHGDKNFQQQFDFRKFNGRTTDSTNTFCDAQEAEATRGKFYKS